MPPERARPNPSACADSAIPRQHFRLEVGPLELQVSLSGPPLPDQDWLLGERFSAFVDGPSATPAQLVHCELQASSDEWLPGPTPPPLSPQATWHEGRWRLHWPFYQGTISPAPRSPDAAVQSAHVALTLCQTPPALEHALRAAAIFCLPPDTLAFHAAALVWNDKGWLIAGHPNAGKSTMSREGRPDRVLTDEIALLQRRGPGDWWLLPSPFWGSGQLARKAAPAPLRGIAVLSQSSDRNRWQAVPGAAAIQALMPHLALQSAAQLADPRWLQGCTSLLQDHDLWSLAWYRDAHPLEGFPCNP